MYNTDKLAAMLKTIDSSSYADMAKTKQLAVRLLRRLGYVANAYADLATDEALEQVRCDVLDALRHEKMQEVQNG